MSYLQLARRIQAETTPTDATGGGIPPVDGRVRARRIDGKPLSDTDRQEAKMLAAMIPPDCWNCGATMTNATDIFGNRLFICWSCAKSA